MRGSISRRSLAAILLGAAIAVGCARVPVESVMLSEAMGRDLATLQAAHINLARQYFAVMRANIETFVDEVYRPYVVRASMEELGLVDAMRDAIENPGDLTPLDIVEIYTEETIDKIESFRREMLLPIEAQEDTLLGDLDRTYTAIRNANATITAHLESIRRVQASQAEVLDRLGLPADLAEKISSGAAQLSQGVERLLTEAQSADESLDGLPARIKALTDSLQRR